MELTTDVRYLKGVGEAKAKALARLGITNVGELLAHFPRSYEDRTVLRTIGELQIEETACVAAMVASEPRLSRVRRGMELVKLTAVDESGRLDITFFNQSYVRDRLVRGESYVFYGKVGGTPARKTLINPQFEAEDRHERTGRILPVYALTAGISNALLRSLTETALPLCAPQLPELLPERIRREHSLCAAPFAYENIHFPRDFESLAIARRRLIFEELFTLQCAMRLLKLRRERSAGRRFVSVDMGEFYASLPFTPTNAQRRAVDDALRDMCSGMSMSRLVQGDVGSGKTLVAAACVYLAWKNGCQSAFMAPTEILAEQHLRTLEGFLAPFGISVGILTGAMGAKARRETLGLLSEGHLDVLVGTHALLGESVQYDRLGLVITDEQHRFGVNQRSALTAKGEGAHVLVMSATPIPRTLALIIYGDLDVSVIDELPPGRQRVRTFAVDDSYRRRLNGFIRTQAAEGHQTFVVCPMVEQNEELEGLRSATEHAEALQREFPELHIGCVHGKMKPKEKEAAMAAFVSGETDVLVSTTVVEVGVDVPNATLMIVENAERFGLSQLHQLRGRVGRGSAQSWCILCSNDTSEGARARLRVLCETNDGFRVAEEDLRLRGPGDFFGERQHGLPEMHVADLQADMDVLRDAQQAAGELMDRSGELESEEFRPLREKIRTMFELKSDTWN